MRWGMELLSPVSYHSTSNWVLEESRSRKWTPAENKMFENALAIYDKDTPDRWQRVAAMIPGKTAWDVMTQYKQLEDDVSSIEAGLIPIPGYNGTSSSFTLEWGNSHGYDGFKQGYGSGGKRSSARNPDHERKKGVPWTEEEHKLFLMGLKKYGKGDWRNISRNFVVTRTPTQVASHAQKYFIRQLSGGKDKRRASIHDITTVNLNDNQTQSQDNQRPPSPQDYLCTTLQYPNFYPDDETQIQWNQPHSCGAMDFNQTHGNMFISSNEINNSYGIHMHQSHAESPNMAFTMQSSHHQYPHG